MWLSKWRPSIDAEVVFSPQEDARFLWPVFSRTRSDGTIVLQSLTSQLLLKYSIPDTNTESPLSLQHSKYFPNFRVHQVDPDLTVRIPNFGFSYSTHLGLSQIQIFWKVKQMILKRALQRITDLSVKPTFIYWCFTKCNYH